MRDETCVDFLQWCLPKLDKRWTGFRKVRGQVCKRITRRMQSLGLRSIDAYRDYLHEHPDEWEILDRLCRITISRFYRDHGVFEALQEELLPTLAEHAAARDARLRCWSAGCASGEEVYTLKILWKETLQPRFPKLDLCLVATDAEAHMLERAQKARYPQGTLKELPADWIDKAFERVEDKEEPYVLRPAYRHGITWRQQDLREEMPEGPFDLILCRNLAFTYFAEPLQRRILQRLKERLRPDGILVLGKHERLPDGTTGFEAWNAHKRIYRKEA